MNDIKYLLYGLTKSLALYSLLELYVSKFGEKIPLNLYITITATLSLIVTAVYFLFIFKEMTLKSFARFCLLSFISFLIGFVITAILINNMPTVIYYIRETNVGDGVMIIVITVCFFLVSFTSETCISIMRIIKKSGK